MAISGILRLDNKEYRVITFSYKSTQEVNSVGKPAQRPSDLQIDLTIESDSSTALLEWALGSEPKDGIITFYKADSISKFSEVEFKKAYCIKHSEKFEANGILPMRQILTISEPRPEIIKEKIAPPKQVIQQEEDRIINVNGHFYTIDGTFEGKINETDFDGSENDVYVCDGKSTQKDRNGNETLTYNNTKILKENDVNITHEKFIVFASIVYGESSFPYFKIDDANLAGEMCALANVHHNYPKEAAFGKNSDAAKAFRKKPIEKRNETKMQLAIAAVINAINDGDDYSNKARYWDGKEQALYPENDDRLHDKEKSYIIHMNTRGWKILDEHYENWKTAIGKSFEAPQIKYSPAGVNKNKITYESTAVWGRTIFWKDVNYKKEDPK